MNETSWPGGRVLLTVLGASNVEMFIAVVPTAAPSGVEANPTTGLSVEAVERAPVIVTFANIGRTNIYRPLRAVQGEAADSWVESIVKNAYPLVVPRVKDAPE